jgi:FdhD protein
VIGIGAAGDAHWRVPISGERPPGRRVMSGDRRLHHRPMSSRPDSTRPPDAPADDARLPDAHLSVPASRLEGQLLQPVLESVVVEAPVALVFNGVSHAVMLATPADLEVFGLGFALAEGVIDDAAECHDLEVESVARGMLVQMRIAEPRFRALKLRRRSLEGRSGCGLCGADSLEALSLDPPRVAAATFDPTPAALARAFTGLRERQPLFDLTGGLHAAGWARPDGEVVAVFEDVGRHNALDKLIGELARRGLLRCGESPAGFVVMSSRVGFELVRKCAQVGIPMLAAVSAPSSMAIDVARRANVALWGFCRGSGAVRYVPIPLG